MWRCLRMPCPRCFTQDCLITRKIAIKSARIFASTLSKSGQYCDGDRKFVSRSRERILRYAAHFLIKGAANQPLQIKYNRASTTWARWVVTTLFAWSLAILSWWRIWATIGSAPGVALNSNANNGVNVNGNNDDNSNNNIAFASSVRAQNFLSPFYFLATLWACTRSHRARLGIVFWRKWIFRYSL